MKSYRDSFEEALTKVTSTLFNMSEEEFSKRLKEHENGKISKAMNMEDNTDWKTLDVNDLSECPDILENGKYEFQFSDGDLSIWHNVKISINAIRHLYGGYAVRYRPTPTKKTDEELAEEYVDGKGVVSGVFFEEGRADCGSYDVRVLVYESFLAGRKSAQEPSC